MNRPPLNHAFVHQLSREWEAIRCRPTELARAKAWSAHLTDTGLLVTLDHLTDLDQVVRATDPNVSAEAADAALVQLVELAQHDQLAGRLIVQRLLPGLISRAAPYRDRCDDIDPAELIVAAAWIAIRHYDSTKRPRFVAASIISDATFQAFRRPLRRRSAQEYAAPGELFSRRAAPPDSTSAFEQLADVVRVARQRGVPAADLQLVRELVDVGSPGLIAARHGVTPRTIRNRRDRAVANIRHAVNAA